MITAVRTILVSGFMAFLPFQLPALGQAEFTDSIQAEEGEVVDELTPVLRTFRLPGFSAQVSVTGPVQLELSQGPEPYLALEASPGLLYQSHVTVKDGELNILLESGLSGPLEPGRLKAVVITGPLTKVQLRRGVQGRIRILQSESLTLELRDQVFLQGEVDAPSLTGLLSWKSGVRLTGAVPRQVWSVQGLSNLRMSGMTWESLELTALDGGYIQTSGTGKVTGSLRSLSRLEIPAAADTSLLTVKEESRIIHPPEGSAP